MGTEVRPVTADLAATLLCEPECFTERFGLVLVPGYLAFPEALAPTVDALEAGVDPAWFAHLLVDPGAGEVVGFGGFTGPPVDGEVEVGYSVAPSRQGCGHATAAVRTWIAAAAARGVRRAVAHTLAEQNASTTVLARCGFRRVGEPFETEDGTVWRWERELGADDARSPESWG